MALFGLDPHVERHLIADEGEMIVDEVTKHWAALVLPVLELCASVLVLLLTGFFPKDWYWIPILGSIAIAVHALWRILGVQMDRFVITNMRVFRVHGILSQHIATMPIARILDISVHVPVIGRIFHYGHFIFESAAQDQGLREIRYVGSPDQRGLTIQRVIQRSGLRGGGRPLEPVRQPAPQTNPFDQPMRRPVWQTATTTGEQPTRPIEVDPWWRQPPPPTDENDGT
jgi:hypothetical protein